MTANRPSAASPPRSHLRANRRERGSAAVELVLVAPLLILVMMMIVACARITTARLHLTQAAPAAARAATLARSATAARDRAAAAAQQALVGAGMACTNVTTQVDGGGWRPGSTVSARVTCTVSLAQLSPLHLAVHRNISATATSVIDRWRAAG